MKKYICIFALLLISGCKQSAKEVKFESLPDGLRDCKVFVIKNGLGSELIVFRCPNSETAVKRTVGRHKQDTVVIERG